jgi:hypothetical protein
MTLENYISEVEMEAEIVDEMVKEVPNLSRAQLNWRALEHSWGIGECFEHLVRVNEYYIEHFRKAAADPENKLKDKKKFKKTFGGRFVLYVLIRIGNLKLRQPKNLIRFIPILIRL